MWQALNMKTVPVLVLVRLFACVSEQQAGSQVRAPCKQVACSWACLASNLCQPSTLRLALPGQPFCWGCPPGLSLRAPWMGERSVCSTGWVQLCLKECGPSAATVQLQRR